MSLIISGFPDRSDQIDRTKLGPICLSTQLFFRRDPCQKAGRVGHSNIHKAKEFSA